jgi:hypothetical protein
MPSPMIILGLLGAGGLLITSFAKGKKTTGPTPLETTATGPKNPDTMPVTTKKQIATVLQELGVNELGQITGTPTAQAIAKATALASMLEQQGYPEAAKALRTYAETASKLVATVASAAPLPGIPDAIQKQIDRVLQMERDPVRLRAVAAALRSLPNANDPEVKAQADMLESMAAQIEAQQKQAQVLTEIQDTITAQTPADFTLPTQPTVKPTAVAPTAAEPQPVKPTVLAPMIVTPKTPIEQAAEAAATNLKSVQRNSGSVKAAKGREDQALVKRFQTLCGTTSDGMAGPGTLGLMAKHGVCDLPYVMYWPKSSTKSRVIKYREAIYAVADSKSEPCASQLRASAARERGQAGIVGAMPA